MLGGGLEEGNIFDDNTGRFERLDQAQSVIDQVPGAGAFRK